MSNKNCSKCGKGFECSSENRGCWCENYIIPEEALRKIKSEYPDCLCEDCLTNYANQEYESHK